MFHHDVEAPRQVAILGSTKKTSKQKFRHRRWIWLDCEQQSVSANLGLLWGKSDLETNTRAVENFLIFQTVICTPWYDLQFRSYVFSKSVGLLKFWADQVWTIWEPSTFDSKSSTITENPQWKYLSWLLILSYGYLHALIRSAVWELRLLEVD
jgi:hypothetical protein